MLRIEGIYKRYGKKEVLKNLSINIPEGSIYTLVSTYGGGKTTLLNIIAGYDNADRGNVYIKDTLCGIRESKSKKLFGFVPDNFPMYDELSGKEYLEFFGRIMSNNNDEQVRHLAVNLLRFVGLGDYIDVRIKKYSYPMRQKLSIARALLHNPKLIILDEPFYGLDVKHVKEIKEIIDFLHDQGRTIFMTSDNLQLSASVSTAVGIMEEGTMLGGEKIKKAYETLVSQSRQKEVTVRNDMIKEKDRMDSNQTVHHMPTAVRPRQQVPDLNQTMYRMPTVGRTVGQAPDLNQTMYQMPTVDRTVGQAPDLNQTMYQMPTVDRTVGQAPDLNQTMYQMPTVDRPRQQTPDLNQTMYQMPSIPRTKRPEENINNTSYHQHVVREPIRMPSSEIEKINRSRTESNLDERISAPKSNRLNIEKRGAGGSRVVTSKENIKKNQQRKD